jgi:hypothetical protein
MIKNHIITTWLSGKKQWVSILYTGLAAFLTYACMYGIRKPFTAAEFQGLTYWGMDYKALLVISQLVGYASSKFIGIRVISEMKRKNRALAIVVLTALAEVSLVLFSLVPPPYNIIFLLLNGLPLGLIWGLVFAYLEGRRNTELLGTILSISFIVSSGFVKSIGRLIMENFHLTDFQMPWVTGLVFLIPLIIITWLLEKSPDPTGEDELERTKRLPMNSIQRKNIFMEFSSGLIMLIIVYMLLTIYRDMRDNFAVDIWKSIGYSGKSMIMTWSELPVALFVFAAMASVMFIKDNQKAFMTNIYIILSGFVIIGLGTAALNAQLISPMVWMILLGLGTYMGYLPFNCLIFDRMIAAFGSAANAGFFIYIADSFGYLGSMCTLIFKNFSYNKLSWFSFLKTSSYGVALTGVILVFLSILYFKSKFRVKSGKEVEPAKMEMKTIIN